MAKKRGGRGKPSAPLLERLGRQFEGVMRADLKGFFATWASRADYDRVADAVYSGDWRQVFATMPLDDIAPLLEQAMGSAGEALLRAAHIEAQNLSDSIAEARRAQGDEPRRLPAPGGGSPPGGAPPGATAAPPGDEPPPKPGPPARLRRDTRTPVTEIEGERFGTMDLPEGGKDMHPLLRADIMNPRAAAYVRVRTGELIQNVTDDLQFNVQNAVAHGLANHLSPRQIAGLIRDNLPLNNRQQGALDKYKAALAQTKMSKKRQAALTERMRNVLTDERATTIARTETQYAINRGMAESWNEAQRQGLIGYNSLKRWQCEAEPCEKICAPMAGVKVRINDQFVLPNGATVYTAPAHVNCRCAAVLEPDT